MHAWLPVTICRDGEERGMREAGEEAEELTDNATHMAAGICDLQNLGNNAWWWALQRQGQLALVGA
jgi:hypothetical protein